MSRPLVRVALVAVLAFALVLPLGTAKAQQICETPPGALACVPFPCLAIETLAASGFDCSIPIPPCGIQVPPIVVANQDPATDAFCYCPRPCIVVYCLPPIQTREAWGGCPIDWESL